MFYLCVYIFTRFLLQGLATNRFIFGLELDLSSCEVNYICLSVCLILLETSFAYMFFALLIFSGRHGHAINSESILRVIFIKRIVKSPTEASGVLPQVPEHCASVHEKSPNLHTHNVYVPPFDVGSRFHPPTNIFVDRYFSHIWSWSSQTNLLRLPISHQSQHFQTFQLPCSSQHHFKLCNKLNTHIDFHYKYSSKTYTSIYNFFK